MSKRRTVNQATFARLIGVSAQRVAKMVSEGLPAGPDGLIDREKGLTWVKRNISRQISRKPGGTRSLVDVRVEAELLKIEKMKLDLAVRRGQFVTVADAQKVWSLVVANCRARLLAMPVKLAPLVACEKDVAVCEGLIRDELYTAMEELASGSMLDGNANALEDASRN